MNSRIKTIGVLTMVVLLTITSTVFIMDEGDCAAPPVQFYEKDADGTYYAVAMGNSAPSSLKGAYINDHVFLGWQCQEHGHTLYPGDDTYCSDPYYAIYGEMPSTIPCFNPTDEGGSFEFTCYAGDIVMLQVETFSSYTFDENLNKAYQYWNDISGYRYYILYPETPGTFTITAKATQPEDYFNKTYTVTVLDPIRMVSFSSEGSVIHTETVEPGSTIQSYTPPARDGYTFGGWYSDTSFTNLFDFSTPINQNITLYAKWIENPVTITFYSEGKVHSTLQVPRGSVGIVYTPVMVEGVFGGWYYDSALTQKYDATRALTEDTNLYAMGVPPLIFTSDPTVNATITLVNSYGMYFFDATDSNGRYQIHWDFGDGNTSSEPIAYNTYTTPGKYTVKLTVTNIYGDSASATYTVQVGDEAAGGGTVSSAPSCWSQSSPSSEVWSSEGFFDVDMNTCPDAGQCVVSGYGKPFTSPTEVFI